LNQQTFDAALALATNFGVRHPADLARAVGDLIDARDAAGRARACPNYCAKGEPVTKSAGAWYHADGMVFCGASAIRNMDGP
jgi:hypothetical protein